MHSAEILPAIRGAAAGCLLFTVFVAGLRGAEPAEQAEPATFASQLKPFLTSYCVSCHGELKQKGDRRFDEFTGLIPDGSTLVDYQDMLDQLNLGEMPPKNARQPADGERRQAIAWLTNRIEQHHREHQRTGGGTVLRRLNSREYQNTIRDLLGLNMAMFNPAEGFPRDQLTDHLDNVGGSLVTSGHLLARYLTAADRVIGKVLTPAAQPAVQTWAFRGNFRQQREIDKVHEDVNGHSHITLYDVVGADKHEGAYGPIWGIREGVPFDGYYEMRFKAEAVNRLHPYDPEFVGTNRDEPLRLGIVAGNHEAGHLHTPQPIEPLLAEMDLADEAKWYSARVWLDAGFTPRFTFRNGLMDARNMWGKLVRKYADQFPKPIKGGIVEHRFNAIKYGKLPQIHIHEVEIQGPFYDRWPTSGQRAVLGAACERALATGTLSEGEMRAGLNQFASRAYRRPARADEVDRLMQLIVARQKTGKTPLAAYRDGLTAVLCSPSFLFLEEPEGSQLPAQALASRLSYFLWSSLPDAELLELAASDKLREPAVLAAQVRRMLGDTRSQAFIAGFLDGWLNLRDLGSMPPDRDKFNAYYRFDLGSAMRKETQLFASHLLDQNLSIVNFLDADFAFVNNRLARLYDIPPPAGSEFTKVSLSDRRRGGLLGQASVLTVTANGIDTSPVVRGVWLLENIFGTPPSPPPPDVEPLDPDVRGAITIREQLQKHRSVASCYDCHQKIDPPGFALENFDAIGAWRMRYGDGRSDKFPLVDAAGELQGGQAFADVVGLKKLLAERVDQFAQCLTEKLLAYSTGRTLEAADRPHVDRIVEAAKTKSYGFQDLILLVVASPPFQSK